MRYACVLQRKKQTPRQLQNQDLNPGIFDSALYHAAFWVMRLRVIFEGVICWASVMNFCLLIENKRALGVLP